MSYAGTIRRRPRTLTKAEQRKLLQVTGRDHRDFRDHVVLALVLTCALRISEVAGLNVGDVAKKKGNGWEIARRLQLRVFKRAKRARAASQYVFLSEALTAKLRRFLAWKDQRYELTDPKAPLFCAQGRRRIATRTLRRQFREWQRRAGFDKFFTFHELRHTSITSIYRATGDVRVAQVHARHADLGTTQIYTHVADEAMAAAVERLEL